MGIVVAATQTGDVTYKQLSDGNGLNGGGGTILGISPLDEIGFYRSAAGVTQPASTGSQVNRPGTVTVYATTQSPTTVNPNTAAEQSITVTGVAVGQLVIINKPTAQAGLALLASRVASANTVGVMFGNDTAASITPTASETYEVTAIPATLLLTAVLSPAAVQPNTSAEQTFAVAGVGAGAAVWVNKPTSQAGLGISGVRAAAAGSIGITFTNFTAATITPTASESYLVFAQAGLSVAPVEAVLTAVLSPTSVNPNTSAEQTFTVAGLINATPVIVNKPSLQPGLSIGGARVSAANTLAITFVNNTAATITPTAGETYVIGNFPGTTPAAGSSTAYNSIAGDNDHGALVALGLIAGP